MDDLISRKAAIDALHGYFDGMLETDTWSPCDVYGLIEILPSARPERLTDGDFETIRIHLNAYKEKLCNQQRWKEADEYQRILDRFISFASAQPVAKDINVPVKDCISRQAVIDAIRKWKRYETTEGLIDRINKLPSAQPVITCDGCKFVGTYDTDFPCRNCIRREKDYYAKE